MSTDRSIEQIVTDVIVELLAVDPSEVTPSARFFADLNGESIDLLDMMFRFEKDPGAKVDFHEVFAGNRIETDESGVVLPQALDRLRTAYSFLPFERLPASPRIENLTDLLTVDAICHLLRNACAARSARGEVSVV